MNREIKVQDFVTELSAVGDGRYMIVDNDDVILHLAKITPDELTDIGIVRLKRIKNASKYWKTIVISTIQSISELSTVFTWIANIKEELVDPESADLYLFTAIHDAELSDELCTNLEASEQFCRKYILRPNERISNMLERTFMSNLLGQQVEGDIVDPLHMAIEKTALKKTTFSESKQNHWREALLSGKSGAELIDALFKENQTPLDSGHETFN